MARPASTQPTDGELEILNVLWEHGPLELGALRGVLLRTRTVAASTVATMLRLMAEKGLVERAERPQGSPTWSARLSQQQARSGLLQRVMDRVFDGSASRLVTHLVEEGELSEGDRQAIRKLLDSAPPAPAKPKRRPRS